MTKPKNKTGVAIRVEGVFKTFKIPHEKHTSLKSAVIHIFKQKKYTIFNALSDVSFEVKQGEFLGIIGRNGSGKSTLLKILAGIYVPESGDIKLNGKLSPFLELGVGFNPELTGRENLYLGGAILGLSRSQIDEKYEKIVKFAELEEFIDMKLKNYSSGMQVRLAFSLSINVQAEILLMDEVLAVGDSNFQEKCLAEFRKYKADGKTVVLVTHDIEVVKKYCDRAILLRNGVIQKIGDVREVTNQYTYENLSDEDKSNKNNEGAPDMLIERDIAEVTSLEFFRGDIRTNEFNHMDDIVVRINYNCAGTIVNPVFGVSIDNSHGVHIVGPNTDKSHFEIDRISGAGHIDFMVKKAPLNFGLYFVTVGIFNKKSTLTYDFKPRIASFKILTIDLSQDSPYKVDYEWING